MPLTGQRGRCRSLVLVTSGPICGRAGGVEVERRVLRDPAGRPSPGADRAAVDGDAERGTGVGDVEEVAVDGGDRAVGRAQLADGLAAYGIGGAEVVERDVRGVEVDGQQVGADRPAVVGLVPLADRQAGRDVVGDVAGDHRRRDAGAAAAAGGRSDPARRRRSGPVVPITVPGSRSARRWRGPRPSRSGAVVAELAGACAGSRGDRGRRGDGGRGDGDEADSWGHRRAGRRSVEWRKTRAPE